MIGIILIIISVIVYLLISWRMAGEMDHWLPIILFSPGMLVWVIIFFIILLVWALICFVLRRCIICFKKKDDCICEGWLGEGDDYW